jgi:hypothetical protein
MPAVLGLTETQFALVLFASAPIIVRLILMYFYSGPNPLQKNVSLLFFFFLLSVSSIYVYYRITA